MSILSLLQAAQAVAAPGWEATKGALITLGSTAAVGSFTLLVKLTLRVRDISHHVVGVDGKNGLKSDVDELKREVKRINARNLAIDAVTEAERNLHPDEDRRHRSRRLRDQIHDAHDTDEPRSHREDSDQ